MRFAATTLCICSLLAALAAPALAATESDKPHIQMAILLDTSGSMRGLINQARTQLWKIVNELIGAKRDGQTPELEVALFQYGSRALPAEQGYLRQVLPLTTDLDKVSEELFALKVGGSKEYCGQAIQAAVTGLAWRPGADDFKAIFIAGNEPFTQGDVDYAKACGAAVAKGVVVNTIHCGDRAKGRDGKWEDAATLGKGDFMNIEQDKVIHTVKAPQDPQIAVLNVALSNTFVPYGAHGAAGKERMAQQDKLATQVGGGSYGQRVRAKTSAYYSAAVTAWDLVAAVQKGQVKLEDLKPEQLPKAMRKMTAEQQKAHIAAKAADRDRIKKEIATLAKARDAYVAAEVAKLAKAAGKETLGSAMIKSMRKQAAARRFELKK